jgi:hypothetical protein
LLSTHRLIQDQKQLRNVIYNVPVENGYCDVVQSLG